MNCLRNLHNSAFHRPFYTFNKLKNLKLSAGNSLLYYEMPYEYIYKMKRSIYNNDMIMTDERQFCVMRMTIQVEII